MRTRKKELNYEEIKIEDVLNLDHLKTEIELSEEIELPEVEIKIDDVINL